MSGYYIELHTPPRMSEVVDFLKTHPIEGRSAI